MNNIKLFFANSYLNISLLWEYLISNNLFIGICIGFLISTAIHLIITLGGPKEIGRVLSNNAEDSYKLLISPNPESPDHTNFARFKRIHTATQVMVFVGLLVMLLIVMYMVLR